jgi:hypothetical protein
MLPKSLIKFFLTQKSWKSRKKINFNASSASWKKGPQRKNNRTRTRWVRFWVERSIEIVNWKLIFNKFDNKFYRKAWKLIVEREILAHFHSYIFSFKNWEKKGSKVVISLSRDTNKMKKKLIFFLIFIDIFHSSVIIKLFFLHSKKVFSINKTKVLQIIWYHFHF